ncbi:MAG: hypothetical protein ACPGVP_02310 [Thiolinea sp.]
MASPKPVQKGYAVTARKLLDGLIVYRTELGETGRQLEILLRMYGVTASSDLPCPKQIH